MFGEKQIDVRFDGVTLAQIEELERLSGGKSALAVLRESVNLTNWMYKQLAGGACLVLRLGSGDDAPEWEVVLPS
jgi:hypothetical protein